MNLDWSLECPVGIGDTAGLNPETEGMNGYVLKIKGIRYSGWACPVLIFATITVRGGGRNIAIIRPTAPIIDGSGYVNISRTFRPVTGIGSLFSATIDYNFNAPIETQETYTKYDYTFPIANRKPPEVIVENVCRRGNSKKFYKTVYPGNLFARSCTC